jgi:hypothetical protein
MDHKIYSFEEQLKLGKKGEQKVYDYLNSLDETVLVEDLSNKPDWQLLGIDALLVSDKGEGPYYSTFFDVKTDFNFHRTGKLFLEISTDCNKSGVLSTKANYFYYYDPYGGNLFELPIYQLLNWYKKIGIAMDHISVKNNFKSEASGIAVSPYDLEMAGVIINKTEIGILDDVYETFTK